jgi:hypothetical protein
MHAEILMPAVPYSKKPKVQLASLSLLSYPTTMALPGIRDSDYTLRRRVKQVRLRCTMSGEIL